MTNNEPSRLDRIEQQLKRLKEPNTNISMEELKQKIAKLQAEAIQRLEARKVAEQSALKPADQERASMQQMIEKITQGKADRLSRIEATLEDLAERQSRTQQQVDKLVAEPEKWDERYSQLSRNTLKFSIGVIVAAGIVAVLAPALVAFIQSFKP